MKQSQKRSFVIIAVGVVIALGLIAMARPAASVHDLGGQAFVSEATAQKATIIDVRTPGEYAAGHIPDAININLEDPQFASNIAKLDPKQTYFVYCHSGNRSGQAVTYMEQHGFKSLYELSGGLMSNPTISLTTATAALPEATTSTAYTVDQSDMYTAPTSTASTGATLTKAEIAGLIQMREEEKLAHDVYLTLGKTWGLQIFTNIAASELTHTDAVKALLDRYGIADPVADKGVGVFASATMQKLYNDLVAKGNRSQTDALVVGATVEDLDIRDLSSLISDTTHTDIKLTYENLQKGSRNHLRAFVRNLNARGQTYTPQYISTSAYQSIIGSNQERGAITTP